MAHCWSGSGSLGTVRSWCKSTARPFPVRACSCWIELGSSSSPHRATLLYRVARPSSSCRSYSYSGVSYKKRAESCTRLRRGCTRRRRGCTRRRRGCTQRRRGCTRRRREGTRHRRCCGARRRRHSACGSRTAESWWTWMQRWPTRRTSWQSSELVSLSLRSQSSLQSSGLVSPSLRPHTQHLLHPISLILSLFLLSLFRRLPHDPPVVLSAFHS